MQMNEGTKEVLKLLYDGLSDISAGLSTLSHSILLLLNRGYLGKEEYEELEDKLNAMHSHYMWIVRKAGILLGKICGKEGIFPSTEEPIDAVKLLLEEWGDVDE